MNEMIDLKENEYVDHIKRLNENEVFVCLILDDGEYIGILHRKDE